MRERKSDGAEKWSDRGRGCGGGGLEGKSSHARACRCECEKEKIQPRDIETCKNLRDCHLASQGWHVVICYPHCFLFLRCMIQTET